MLDFKLKLSYAVQAFLFRVFSPGNFQAVF